MAITHTTLFKTWDLTTNDSGLDFGSQFQELLDNDIELQSLIDGLTSGASTLAGRVTTNETDIATAQGDITALEGRADALEAFQLDPFDDKTLQIKDGSGNVMFEVDKTTGQIKNVYNSTVGTDYATTLHEGWLCRAWVNFNGTGTVAIRASANVTSITDNGTGDYTLNFATSLPDTSYALLPSVSPVYGANEPYGALLFTNNTGLAEVAPTVSAARISFRASGAGAYDPKYVTAAVFR